MDCERALQTRAAMLLATTFSFSSCTKSDSAIAKALLDLDVPKVRLGALKVLVYFLLLSFMTCSQHLESL